MVRLWIVGLAVVTLVAGLKTYLMSTLALPDAGLTLVELSGLFALFFGLTAGVAYLSFAQLRSYMDRQRKEKLAPGAGEPIAKETVILRYAAEWGLSQAEADVAIFVVKGFSNSEIAEMRGSAPATIKSQLGRIYQKTGLDSRYQLIAFVTDEVCGMAAEPENPDVQLSLAQVLPLPTRARPAA